MNEITWPHLREATAVVWFGTLSPPWVSRCAAAGVPQIWFPDCSGLRTHSGAACEMHEIVCTYKAMRIRAEQCLPFLRKRIRLVPWAVSGDNWKWPPAGTSDPVLDITCGNYRTTSPILAISLHRWLQKRERHGTLLYDNVDTAWRRTLAELRDDPYLTAVRINQPHERQLIYTSHGIWWGPGGLPHLGLLLRQAAVLGMVPVVRKELTDLVDFGHNGILLDEDRSLRNPNIQRGAEYQEFFATLADLAVQLAGSGNTESLWLQQRREAFEAYWRECFSHDQDRQPGLAG